MKHVIVKNYGEPVALKVGGKEFKLDSNKRVRVAAEELQSAFTASGLRGEPVISAQVKGATEKPGNSSTNKTYSPTSSEIKLKFDFGSPAPGAVPKAIGKPSPQKKRIPPPDPRLKQYKAVLYKKREVYTKLRNDDKADPKARVVAFKEMQTAQRAYRPLLEARLASIKKLRVEKPKAT